MILWLIKIGFVDGWHLMTLHNIADLVADKKNRRLFRIHKGSLPASRVHCPTVQSFQAAPLLWSGRNCPQARWHRCLLSLILTSVILKRTPDQVLWKDLGSFTTLQGSGHIFYPLRALSAAVVTEFSSGTVEIDMGGGQHPVVLVNISNCSRWIDIYSQFKQSYLYCPLYPSPFCILLFERFKLKVLKVSTCHRTHQTGTSYECFLGSVKL